MKTQDSATRWRVPPFLLLSLLISLGCRPPQHVASGHELGEVELADGRCAGGNGASEDEKTAIAREIIHAPSQQVYVAGGGRPIADDAWEELEPSFFPWQKNSTRHLLSAGGCLFRSPDAAPECTGQACFSLTEAADATWLYLARVACTGCYPVDGPCDAKEPIPPAGHLRVVDLEKCHDLRFEGEIFELTDPWGQVYVMHASAAADREAQRASLGVVDLPAGWSVAARTLVEPLLVRPRLVDGACHHTIIRDDQDNSYHLASDQATDAVLSAIGCGP